MYGVGRVSWGCVGIVGRDRGAATHPDTGHRLTPIYPPPPTIKQQIQLENDQIRLRREAKASGSFYVPAEPKVGMYIWLYVWSAWPSPRNRLLTPYTRTRTNTTQ